jgi:hypothetical protein
MPSKKELTWKSKDLMSMTRLRYKEKFCCDSSQSIYQYQFSIFILYSVRKFLTGLTIAALTA